MRNDDAEEFMLGFVPKYRSLAFRRGEGGGRFKVTLCNAAHHYILYPVH